MGYSLSCSPMLLALNLQVHAYTLTNETSPCTVTGVDALVRVNPSSNLLKKLLYVTWAGLNIFRLTMLFATNRAV